MEYPNRPLEPRRAALVHAVGLLLATACTGDPGGQDESTGPGSTGAPLEETGATSTSTGERTGSGTGHSGDAPDDCVPIREALELAAHDFVQLHGVPGIVVAASTPACPSVAAASGLADLARQVPMDSEHRLGMGSNSKSFVAALMLLLQEEGTIDLDDPLGDYVATTDVPDADIITIRQLMTHRSGLADFQSNTAFVDALMAEPGRVWEPMELVTYAVELGPLFAPGQGWTYANTNYILVGIVAEQVTGEPLGTTLRERVLEPVGLHATYLDGEEMIEGELARGYYMGLDVTGYLHPSWAWASGAMVTTADDLATYMDALLRGSLLNDVSKNELVDWVSTGGTPIAHYGLGLFLQHRDVGTIVGHNGGIPGYKAAMGYRFGTDDIVVALFNVLDDTDPLLAVDAGLAALDAMR
jgi:D-alanyl-D-alanine carboxypeptidase